MTSPNWVPVGMLLQAASRAAARRYTSVFIAFLAFTLGLTVRRVIDSLRRRQVCDLSMLRRVSFIRLLMTDIAICRSNECAEIVASRALSVAEEAIRRF